MALHEPELDEQKQSEHAASAIEQSEPLPPEVRERLLAVTARIDADPPPTMTHEELLELLAPHLP